MSLTKQLATAITEAAKLAGQRHREILDGLSRIQTIAVISASIFAISFGVLLVFFLWSEIQRKKLRKAIGSLTRSSLVSGNAVDPEFGEDHNNPGNGSSYTATESSETGSLVSGSTDTDSSDDDGHVATSKGGAVKAMLFNQKSKRSVNVKPMTNREFILMRMVQRAQENARIREANKAAREKVAKQPAGGNVVSAPKPAQKKEVGGSAGGHAVAVPVAREATANDGDFRILVD